MCATPSQPCPLCNCNGAGHYHQDSYRRYLQCANCRLVFVPRQDLPTALEEKAHYDTHENQPDDPGYRRFLGRLLVPLTARLQRGARGLDFGSGPGPTLSVMLEELGFPTAIYDVFYANQPSVLQDQYDFITLSETVEHLHHPRRELERLWSLLRPGGCLAVMTQLLPEPASFSRWYYIRDPTHVCFFSHSPFAWLADHWQTQAEFVDSAVVLMNKP